MGSDDEADFDPSGMPNMGGFPGMGGHGGMGGMGGHGGMGGMGGMGGLGGLFSDPEVAALLQVPMHSCAF
jgi:hypothetical protein